MQGCGIPAGSAESERAGSSPRARCYDASPVSYKAHFARALGAAPDRIHLAAHSHHLWPDVTWAAHSRAWEDAIGLADQKWGAIFSELLPRAQSHVARHLGLGSGASVAFAPNTHSLLLRVLSCLPTGRPLSILTSGSEFHSFARQIARLEEDGLVTVERIPSEPFADFAPRFARAAQRGGHDLVYLSHVFFDSGFAVDDLSSIVDAVPSRETFVVVDGYHAFLARPVSLGPLADRVFYLAGGYKYAMSGEGCCFLHAPEGYGERPRDTGWFAAFGALADARTDRVAYAPGGARFLGATFDPTALYRFDAVMSWLSEIGLDAAKIHAHALALQERFVEELDRARLPFHSSDLVVPLSERRRGQFLTFRSERAADLQARLLEVDVVTDVRGDRLRVGFGLYHDESDVERAIERMRRAL